MAKTLLLLVVTLFVLLPTISSKQPNIIFILTDDQDVELGGMTPMVSAKKLIGDKGITFDNMFVTSPLCCPSRSAILTGMYNHNNRAINNSISGNCSSPQWQQTAEKETFAAHLKKQGYNTFFAGKYLNQYGYKPSGGVEHVPPGWDDWNGLVGNSVYYNYSLSVNGKEEKHGDKYPDDYLTDVISKKAERFLENEHETFGSPFFMMLSTPACHAPFTPAPQHRDKFANVTAPRDGSFNKYDANRHWLVRNAKHPMGNESMKLIDPVFRNRWRTLLSVDDLITKLFTTLETKGFLEDTYVFYAADNGYHLGQLSLPYDKRQLYEFDIRVPLMVRGPGIKAGQKRKEIILNIDLAPTFIDIAGKIPPSSMDGSTFKSVLLDKSTNVSSTWRTDFMVEHTGETQDNVKECPSKSHKGVAQCFPDCVCEDSYNNTYSCVRSITDKGNSMYCEFSDSENFVELYDLSKDPHQLKNIAKSVDPKILVGMNKRLVELTICEGPTCKPGVKPFPPQFPPQPRSLLHSNIYSEEIFMEQNGKVQVL
ncbi:hypothetical protein CAPTEDRAFT_122955 [Capitella teleta]|uniref:Sulfatase N-terminal domain-containing protein n=1 Tax=Capitella teleta TaxID=283909 RepID=R7TJ59_CAPTE|nr:hypothetical protein CAPTEDRAFT_122955 [Capitella teleta]|eukprot:ELT91586.1 hypothetical protein CAPTEDRAFT_122955 [Capitella teleta]